MTNWYCTFHYPKDWIEVVHQPAGPTANGTAPPLADQVNAALSQGDRPDPAVAGTRTVDAVLPLVEQDAERAAAVSAHGFQDIQGHPVHMHLTLWVEPRSYPESVSEELDLLAATVRNAGVNLAPPDVTEVSLPAGRALRVRQLENVHREDGTVEMIDCVDHWVPVEGSPDMLWVHQWTADLAAAENVVPLFDRIAEALVLEV
jgi:hypothetical protein